MTMRMHTEEGMPDMAFTHFFELLNFLVEKDSRNLAVELVYDYYGGNILREKTKLCNIVLGHTINFELPGWLMMPFLTLSKSYKELDNYDKAFGYAMSKWEMEMSPKHMRSTVNRLTRKNR